RTRPGAGHGETAPKIVEQAEALTWKGCRPLPSFLRVSGLGRRARRGRQHSERSGAQSLVDVRLAAAFAATALLSEPRLVAEAPLASSPVENDGHRLAGKFPLQILVELCVILADDEQRPECHQLVRSPRRPETHIHLSQ